MKIKADLSVFNLKYVLFGVLFVMAYQLLKSCSQDDPSQLVITTPEVKENYKFGYNLSNYNVVFDTIQRGDSFGIILERHGLFYPEIHHIVQKTKEVFDIRQLRIGKPYMVLRSKDGSNQPQGFIYQQNKVQYLVVEFCEEIIVFQGRKPTQIIQKEAFGVIENTLSETMDKQGLPAQLIYDMSDDIYAWTIDFTRLQKGDYFKVIYNQRMVDDTIYAGIHSIDAAFFQHNNEPLYAFNYISEVSKTSTDYYNEKGKSLQKAFLKSPVKFSRISSRYNPKRRIALYGNKVRPHKGTDFAASVGTPILATAKGRVIESTRRGGNGNYVKIRHNATYSTQYLHMSKRLVKKGDFVQQGDVIGKVGMTGNTSGPHVCYRFWKNGKQVDPFRQKLPESKSIPEHIKTQFLTHIVPVKQQLDAIEILIN